MSILAVPFLIASLCQQPADKPAEVSQPPTGWQAKTPTTLKNTPRIVETKRTVDEVWLTAFNDGDTTLQYFSVGVSHIQEYQDTEVGDSWKAGSWDWCGTGKAIQTIEPGKSAQLQVRFWDKGKRERLLGRFAEKDTKRTGFVVLAVEPAK